MTSPAPAAPFWRADRWIHGIALAVGGIGVLGLAGWIFQIPIFLRFGQHAATMRFNAALCFVLTAVALWCDLRQSTSCTRIVRSCGIALAVIGGLSWLERLFGWDFHIDQLLWRDTISPGSPGQMAAITGFCFTLIGLNICLRQGTDIGRQAAQWMSITVALGAQWAVLEVLLRPDAANGIALPSAFALLAVSFALLISPNRQGMLAVLSDAGSGGRILRRLLPLIIIAPLLLGCVRWYVVQQAWLEPQAGLALMVTVLTASLLLAVIWSVNFIERVERQRQRVENELAGFFRLPIHSLLSIIGYDGIFRRISSSWSSLLGYSQEQILATPYIEFVHPDDRQMTRQVAGRIAAGEPATEFENRYLAADGSTRWLMWNAIPADSDVMYAIAEDVTQRKEALNQLRQSEERLRLLIEGLRGHAVYMLDPEGGILTWNSGAQELTGYSAAEVIGQPLTMLYPPESEVTIRNVLQQAATVGHVEHHGYKLRKDGTRFLVETYIASLRDEDGTLLGFAKISRDITERAEAEQKIRELNDELEHKVEERTAQLAVSNKELEAFAYSVSHDLRAPLRHLDGFLSLLEKRASAQLDERGRHYIANATGASRRMGTLIDELLQFSRLGRNRLRRMRVNLAEVVAKIRQELQSESANRRVIWDLPALPEVDADASMLRQLMQNLIANALKFTRGRAEAQISVGARTESDGAVTLWVRDNGVGFDMQYYDKLFQVFQRLHHEDEFEGTGIGLANVRRIAERHGGRVWAESVLGEGATFYVCLPQNGGEVGEDKDEPVEAYSAGGR